MDPPEVVIDEERAREWISKGAQPSEAVQRMLNNLEKEATV
jgi:ribosomal protein S16|tara:strand:- start:174 stop:296 length:123 start_codon:yes stop_codon:yes gene_type:complete